MTRIAENLKKCFAIFAFWLAPVVASQAVADSYDLPTDGSMLVGKIHIVIPTHENTLLDIARHYDVGYHEITWANPDINVWTPGENARVVVPTQFILPPKPWKGIIVNISQRRLFYFPATKKGEAAQVITFPISIAREGWSTPLGETKVVAKHKDPAWFVPKSIQAEHKQQGEIEFPEYFPPGPDNPMGMLAIQTGFPGIFIHGTNRPWGVGMRTSHGCLHLYPEDAAILFPLMNAGIPIRVIDEPFVVGTQGDQLMMASYEPVAEYGATANLFTRAVLALTPYLKGDAKAKMPALDVAWDKIQKLVDKKIVVPISVSPGGKSLEDTISSTLPEPYDFPPYGVDANDASLPGE
ncbi:MAG TPA: L,D-transpeptidase family protein [Pseudomonadales bacterium]|nr:L,D-transpeptidase family protein [Pseudomonadales bacterium]